MQFTISFIIAIVMHIIITFFYFSDVLNDLEATLLYAVLIVTQWNLSN